APMASTLMSCVLEWLEIFARPDARPPAAATERLERHRREDAAAAREQIADAEAALGNLAAQLARGVIGETAYKAGAAELERDLAAAREKLRRSTEAARPDDLYARLGIRGDKAAVEKLAALGSAVSSGALTELSVEDQARALRGAIARIEVAPPEVPGQRFTRDRLTF